MFCRCLGFILHLPLLQTQQPPLLCTQTLPCPPEAATVLRLLVTSATTPAVLVPQLLEALPVTTPRPTHSRLPESLLLPPHELISAAAPAGVAALQPALACRVPKKPFLWLVTPCNGRRALGFGAWKLGLQVWGFHTKAEPFPSSARTFQLPEEEISWPVPTIAPWGFCQVVSHSPAFGIGFADSFFSICFPRFSLCGSPLMSSTARLSQGGN